MKFMKFFVAIILPLLIASPSFSSDKTTGPMWLEIPDSRLDSVAYDWAPAPVPGHFPGIISAWSGAAFDSSENQLIIMGGGHGDYGGQELYAFDLNSLTWSRISEPETYEALDLACTHGGRTDNNLPKAMHTYDGLEYIPYLNSVCDTRASVGYKNCRGVPEMACFDLEEKTWNWLHSPIKVGWSTRAGALHQETGEWWVQGGGYNPGNFPAPPARLGRYIPKEDRWEYGAYDNVMADYNKIAEIDPTRNLFVLAHAGSLYAFDLATFSPGKTKLKNHPQPTTGATEILSLSSRMGLAYDPVGDRMVAWAGGADVFYLNLDTWHWTKETPQGAVPTPAAKAGTFGRFAYSSESDKFIVVNSVRENVYMLDLGRKGAIE